MNKPTRVRTHSRDVLAIIAICATSILVAGCDLGTDGEWMEEEQVTESQSAIETEDADGNTFETINSDEGNAFARTPPSPDATASFWATCLHYKEYVTNLGTGAIVWAYSDGCRRRNGTYGGATSWSGNCFGDVSNCNGQIVCQNHCP